MLPHHQWQTAATTVITFELNNFFFYSFFYIIFLINKRQSCYKERVDANRLPTLAKTVNLE